RQPALDGLVKGSDQGLQLWGGEEMHLVNQEYDAAFVLARRFSERNEEICEVLVEFSAIGEAFGGRDVQAGDESAVGGDGELEGLEHRRCLGSPSFHLAFGASWKRARRTSWAMRASNEVCLVISASTVVQPRSRARSSKLVSNTVFPTPRRPVMSIDCSV